MNLYIFWKNVNKQLKSADFFSETSKFQKSLLTQNFDVLYRDVKTYLNLCSPSTQHEISHLSDIHCPICRKIEMEKVLLKNSIDNVPLIPKVFCIKWGAHVIQRNILKIEIFYKSWRKSVNFLYVTDLTVIVAGDKYNQCYLVFWHKHKL